MNFFSNQAAAQRYAKGRPYFHPLVIQKITKFTGISRFADTIDVCCGTGLSTKALRQISDRVLGTDLAPEMIELAPPELGISYLCCPAEALPLPDSSFDLMTVALGLHWLDRSRFFTEARRVLRPGAWLVNYGHGFTGQMRGNPAFSTWNHESYLKRYPTPPRNHSPFTKADAAQEGFDFVSTEDFTNDIRFSVEELACYLSTQSNMIAAVEGGHETIEEALEWLVSELQPLFGGEPREFNFAGSIWYLRKV